MSEQLSVHYMFDNHTFMKLDDLSIDEAIDLVEWCSGSEGGYGFVGAKAKPIKCPTCNQVTRHPVAPKSIHLKPGIEWEPEVRAMLQLALKDSGVVE